MKYDNILTIEGKERVFLSEMVVTEEQGGGKETRMVYGQHLIKPLSEDYFDYQKLAPDRLKTGAPGKR